MLTISQSGPITSMLEGWKLLRSGLSIEPEQRYSPEGVAYLGCVVERTTSKLDNGRVATVITYNMERFISACVGKYCELAQVADLRA
eukprot:10216320-Lingulodinium_polyedra.AAC.1